MPKGYLKKSKKLKKANVNFLKDDFSGELSRIRDVMCPDLDIFTEQSEG